MIPQAQRTPFSRRVHRYSPDRFAAFSPAFISATLLNFALVCASQAATYYIDSAAGNDNNTGASQTAPWKTIAKVNKTRFSPGDQILFHGGQVHSGNLAFSNTDSGAAANPVVVSSYGAGRANIYAATGDGVKLSGTSYMVLTNLNVTGPGWNSVNDGSRGVVLAGSASNCTLENLTVSGFHKAGVRTESNSHDNRIASVRAEQNGYIGIHISGNYQLVTDCQAFNNNGDITVTNNWSGSGILSDASSYVTIEYCEAAFNGANQPWTGNGPVGIWCWNADHVIIRHCISHHNLRGRGNADGGGFDLDGGTTDSVIEYCYSYANAGAGYLLYNFNWQSIPHRNNTVRYCISENDKLGGIAIGTGGLPIENLNVYHNTCFNTNGSIVLKNYNGTMTNVALRNNIWLTSGTLTIGSNSFILQGNCYYSTAGAYSFGSYGSNFSAWANATGKEKYSSQIVGLNIDPVLLDIGNGAKLTNPRDLSTLRSYSPASGYSPVIDAGLDLQTLFAIHPGSVDIASQPAPNGPSDMGAYEFQGETPTDTIPPSVSLTAPTEGALVSGSTVTVSATASDDVGGSGIAGVQFRLDGVNVEAEDTSSPYTIVWNTTSITNGSHVLTAVARDFGGNATESAPVNVTVYNETDTDIWLSSDVGAVAAAGSASYDEGTGVFTVNGSGADIWGSADEFHFARRSVKLSGDGTITAKVISAQSASGSPKIGVMIRETLDANAKNVAVMISQSSGVVLQHRSTVGGSTSRPALFSGLLAPYWLRLTRSGNTFTGYHSPDGISWTLTGTVAVAMATDVEVGLGVCSRADGVLCQTLFSDVIVTSP